MNGTSARPYRARCMFQIPARARLRSLRPCPDPARARSRHPPEFLQASRRRDASPRRRRFGVRPGPPDAGESGATPTRHSYRGGTSADKVARLPPSLFSSLRHVQLPSRLIGQQQRLQRGPRRALKLLPLLQGHQNRSACPAPRHNLWAFLQAGLEQLAEPRLCILNRPTLHGRTLEVSLVR